MKRFILCLVMLTLGTIVRADVLYTVKDVHAQQRYPWNGKVDIDFTVGCADSTMDLRVAFKCFDNIGNTNIIMKTIRYNDAGDATMSFKLRSGNHRVTWNADADAPNAYLSNVSFEVFVDTDTAEYLIVDLSAGSTASAFPTMTIIGVPVDGWTDEYKTTKLVLRRCPAGADPLGRYTLSKDFYAGVFEVTQKQWYLVQGFYAESTEPMSRGPYPVHYVSYDDIRGADEGAKWPETNSVDKASFIGRLRTKTQMMFDLPTEAQWEYACRAGTTTTYNTGDSESDLSNAGWYSENSKVGTSGISVHFVGLKTANAWGLYDMHGNMWEWCLDWHGGSLHGKDPAGATTGSTRRTRGGGIISDASAATSSYGSDRDPSSNSWYHGFRLFMEVP